MKRAFIRYNRTNIDSDRQNIYITETKNGKYNIPQQITCPCSLNNEGYYVATVTDNELDGCNNFGLSLTLPEIKGKGSIRYQTNFAYKLIDHCIIETTDVKNNIIIQKSGLEFLMEFNRKEKVFSNIIGNNKDFCTFKTGKFSDDIIFSSSDIYIPLIFIFDHPNMNPRTCLRIYPETKLEIKIKFRPFNSVLLYDNKYRKESISNITDVDLQPYIKFTGYNTCGSAYKHRYVEELITSEHMSDKKMYHTPEFTSITNLLWYSKSFSFSGNEFISYPNFPETEDSFINAFIERLLSDLVIISKTEDFMKSKEFSSKCKFKKIKSYDTIKFDINNSCTINILNVPEDYSVYFHTNILSFSRRNDVNEYNISKKFNYILGTYSLEDNKIILHDVKHNISISDVSIPVNIWDAQENTSTRDLRSVKSKKNDIIVNDPFIFGLDFLSKESGFITRSITSSSNESITENNIHNVNFESYFSSENLYTVTPITEYSNPSIYIYRFNLHNILYIEPSRLIADFDKNFRYINIAIDWKNFSDVDPRSLIKKQLLICMTRTKKIMYDNNVINTQIL